MSAKNLKLGWTVSETIGVAVVNPRGINSMKAIPRFHFQNEQGGIDIRRYSITITGSHEAAAKVFAEELLSRKLLNEDRWSYCEVIKVSYINNKYSIYLTENGIGLIDPEVWATFSKNAEKICNDLKAFL